MESFNSYVFTTRRVMLECAPVVRVLHEVDGDWQFLSQESDLTAEDAMIVSFEEMMNHDSTLKDVICLTRGRQAIRESIGSCWHFFDI